MRSHFVGIPSDRCAGTGPPCMINSTSGPSRRPALGLKQRTRQHHAALSHDCSTCTARPRQRRCNSTRRVLPLHAYNSIAESSVDDFTLTLLPLKQILVVTTPLGPIKADKRATRKKMNAEIPCSTRSNILRGWRYVVHAMRL